MKTVNSKEKETRRSRKRRRRWKFEKESGVNSKKRKKRRNEEILQNGCRKGNRFITAYSDVLFFFDLHSRCER
jgi:hypothetical protein